MPLSLKDFPGWSSGWKKPDRRPIPAWGRDELTLPPSYAIQGKFDISITRPLEQVFADIQNPLINRIRFRKPPRFGGSMVADIAIPWIICNDPGPIMWNWQSDEDAKGHMKQKAWALWRSSKQFKAMLPQDRHDKTNTEIYFGPFFLVCQGANINNLQGVGVRWLFNDETWLPVWQDLYQHAVYRTRDYERAGSYKICDVSQAGNVGDVEDRNWRQGNQCQWGYRANNGKLVPLLMGGRREDKSRWGLIWNEDAKRLDGSWNKARAIETARYVCKETGQEWLDRPETIAAWNRDGAYIVGQPEAAPNSTSYAVNGLLNRSFASLVDEHIDALEMAARGDMGAMRDWVQKSEVRPWEETVLSVTISDKLSGYRIAEYETGEKIDNEKIRMMSADRQHGMAGDTPHRWCTVHAFRHDGSSRLLFAGRVDTKEAMRELQLRYQVGDRCVWQDGRFEKHLVFQECVEYGWMACFGSNQTAWVHEQADPKNPGGEKLKVRLPYSPIQQSEVAKKMAFYISYSEDYSSDILANLLAGRGLPFERPDDVTPDFDAHMRAEHKVMKSGRYTWEKIHATKPNHLRDCSKQAIAFALVMKLLSLPKNLPEAKAQEAA
jgi:hypothetical protein